MSEVKSEIVEFQVILKTDRVACIINEAAQLIETPGCKELKLIFMEGKLVIVPMHEKIDVTI